MSPFADKCRVNTWNRTDRKRSPLGDLLEFARTSNDALGAAWIGNLIAYTGLLRKVSSLVYGVETGSNLILESNKAINRTRSATCTRSWRSRSRSRTPSKT